MHHIEMYVYKRTIFKLPRKKCSINAIHFYRKRPRHLIYYVIARPSCIVYIRHIRNKTALSFIYTRRVLASRGNSYERFIFFNLPFSFRIAHFQYDRALFNYFRSVALYAIFVINIYERPKSTHRQ